MCRLAPEPCLCVLPRRDQGRLRVAQFYRIRTHHQTSLFRLPSGEMCHGQPETGSASLPEILAYAPSVSCAEIILMTDSEGDVPIGVKPEAWTNPLYPMRRILQEDGSWALAHPYSGFLVIALPIEGGETKAHCLISDNLTAGGWESFNLEPVEPTRHGTAKRGEAAAKAVALARNGLQSLLPGLTGPALTETVARLVPQVDFDATAKRFSLDHPFATAVVASAGDDPFRVGLHNLLATAPAASMARRRTGLFRRKPPVLAVDYKNDARFASLAETSRNGRFTSVFDKLCATARRQRLPRRRLCAVATVRDEGPYLLEWLAHHRALGVEHFFIASNDNADGSDALLAALDAAGIVSWVSNTGATSDVQLKAYRHVLSINPDVLDYEWAMLLDLDEFVTLDAGGFQTIPDFLAWQEHRPVDVVALAWCLFWSSGQVRWSEEPVTTRFRQQNHGASLVKSIFRPRNFTYAHPHHPIPFDNTVGSVARDSSGAVLSYPRGRLTGAELPEMRFGKAWISHYFSKSAEEFFWKWTRNAEIRGVSTFAEVPEHFIQGFIDHHQSKTMDMPDQGIALADAKAAEMATLLKLPKVHAAAQHILQQRREKSSKTLDLVRSIDFRDLSVAKQSFLRLLST